MKTRGAREFYYQVKSTIVCGSETLYYPEYVLLIEEIKAKIIETQTRQNVVIEAW